MYCRAIKLLLVCNVILLLKFKTSVCNKTFAIIANGLKSQKIHVTCAIFNFIRDLYSVATILH